MLKLVTEKIRKIIKNHVSLKSKTLKFIGKTMVFDDLEVACANGKAIKKTAKMRPKSIRNSMKNRSTNHGFF